MTAGTAESSKSGSDRSDRVYYAAKVLRELTPTTPRVGIILGSGLGGVVSALDVARSVSYDEIPGFPRSTAPGHDGRLVLGSLNGTPAVILQGRTHLYEGGDAGDVTFGVEVLHALGVGRLILTNAAGGLNPQLSVGDLVVIDAHVNFTGARFAAAIPEAPFPGNRSPRLYSPELADRALTVCRRQDITVHRGVYVAVTGPNYETRAEYRMFRALGGDVIGMSTVPEALTAVRLGLEVLAISVVTNVCQPDRPAATDGAAVVEAARRTDWKLRRVLAEVVGTL